MLECARRERAWLGGRRGSGALLAAIRVDGGAASTDARSEGAPCIACLTATGTQALAPRFSPVVERPRPRGDARVAGLERASSGAAQDVAAAIARRAAETRAWKANSRWRPIPMPPSARRADFAGVGIVPQGDEAKFLGTLPLALLAPSPELAGDAGALGHSPFSGPGRAAAAGDRRAARRRKDCACANWRAAKPSASWCPSNCPSDFEEEIELEYPVELLEPLAFLLARLVNGLARGWPRARWPPMSCASAWISKTAPRTSARCGCPCRRSIRRRF